MNLPKQGVLALTIGLIVSGSGCVAVAAGGPTPIVPTPETRYRAYDTEAGEFISAATLAERIQTADVVFFGETHNDEVAHRIQLELVERLAAVGTGGILAMEMFERDVQEVVDDYVAGRIDEVEFLANSRPWSNYERDYRPLVEAAVGNDWTVIASNLPQALASSIARYGIGTLASLDLDTRRQAAAELQCPEDDYWLKFVDAMRESSAADSTAHPEADPLLKRTYEAQCARDETMASALAAASGSRAILHVNGAFHSDYHLGIVPRLERRRPDASVLTISAIPGTDLTDPPIDENEGRADFLIFTDSPE